jgi:branched-chain amino acid transport system substrate-binding protein
MENYLPRTTRRSVLGGGSLLLAAAGRRARAAAPLRLGVLTDMSSFGRDSNGPGSVEAARMAVAEFGPTVLGRPIELLVGDHQERVDVGAQIARKWFDEDDVRAIIDVPNSAIGISVHNLAREKDRIALLSGTFSSDVTNQLCSPNTVQFGLDTYAMGTSLARSLMADGAKSWFFITADFAFGAALRADATAAIVAGGGRVVGEAKHPVNTSDFSSFLLTAQASGADVIAFANSAGDTANSLKQAAEFGLLAGRQKIAVFLMFDTNIKALGLGMIQGTYAPIWTYWDTDDRTRAWSQQFFARIKAMPTSSQTGCYSGTLHYLKSVAAAGGGDTGAVMEKMRALPIYDAFIRDGRLRADGRVLKNVALGRVKTPAQSKGDWDFIEILQEIPADRAFRPASESQCILLRS